jgi:enoyl-CoA hydratase/carnithine racemase
MSSDISSNKKFIEDTFQYDLPKIISILKNSKDEFSQKIYTHMLTRCPMSLAITVKLIKNAQSKTLKECLEIEYQLSQHMVYREDFNNGVDSVLISKNHKANWNPTTVENIDYDEVDKMFELHVEKLYI